MTITCAECGKEMTGDQKVIYLVGWDDEFCSEKCLINCVRANYEIESAKYLE